ncbi:MAG: DUF2384 domain-containing protein [Cytophagales bacterium]|nr:DUF2384 domain-containing protein [Cytophagales bacterium]
MAVREKHRSFDLKKRKRDTSIGMINQGSYCLNVRKQKITWDTDMDKIQIIRNGLPYECIEAVGSMAAVPVKFMLERMGIPQTTYNKGKREASLMSGRDSEIVLDLFELMQFGVQVFNGEKEKFQRWLKKTNISLGNQTPESLFDSITGIQEVKNCLNRLEFGNFA